MKRLKLLVLLITISMLITQVAYASGMWNMTYEKSGDDAFISVSYSSGYVIATGYTMGQYPLVQMWDLSGNKNLDKVIITESGALGVASTVGGGYIYTTGSIDDGNGYGDVFLAKIDMKTGKIIFLKTYGGSSNDEPRAISWAGNGIVIAGITNSTDGTFACGSSGKGFVMKVDTAGNVKWSYCDDNNTYTEYNDLFIKDGNIYVVGSKEKDFLTDILVLSLDMSGLPRWQTTIDGNDYDYGYGITGDSTNLYIAGTTFSNDIPGFHGKKGITSDGIVASLSYDGKVKWVKAFGGDKDDELFDIASTFLGPVAVGYTRSGNIKGYVGGDDNYIVSLTSYGKVRYEKAWGTDDKDQLWSIAASPYDIVYTAGWKYTGDSVSGSVSGLDEDSSLISTTFPYSKAITLRIWQSDYLKGDKVSSMGDVFPFIDPRYSRSLVPIRFVAEGLGYEVGWDNKNRIVTIKGNGATIYLYMKEALDSKTTFKVKKPTGETITMTVYEGSQIATVNGKQVKLSAKPLIYGGRTFVPIRFISETLGSTVKWIPPDGVRIVP